MPLCTYACEQPGQSCPNEVAPIAVCVHKPGPRFDTLPKIILAAFEAMSILSQFTSPQFPQVLPNISVVLCLAIH